MQQQKEFITYNFNLPNHSNELSKAENIIEKYQQKLKKYQHNNRINDNEHTALFEDTIRILDYVGRLSMSAFAIEDELQDMYTKQYIHSPELAKKLWLDHFENIHHPYNILKNRCFRILEEVDELYQNVHKKNPPNWKY
jgi:predicted DNA-binding transcriptional regulator